MRPFSTLLVLAPLALPAFAPPAPAQEAAPPIPPEATAGVAPEPDLTARAVALHRMLHDAQSCPLDAAPTRATVLVDAGGEAPQEVTIWRFDCDAAAYNMLHSYIIADVFGDMRPIAFAVPTYTVRYGEDEPTGLFEGPVAGIDVTGYGVRFILTNSTLDPTTGEITENAKWRGLGDAGSSGSWMPGPDGYALRRYVVDPSYDGQINPLVLVDLP